MRALDLLEVELLRRTRWLSPAIGWSVRLAIHGPFWFPRPVKLLPLRVCVVVVRLYLWWIENGLQSPPRSFGGMGGIPPMVTLPEHSDALPRVSPVPLGMPSPARPDKRSSSAFE